MAKSAHRWSCRHGTKHTTPDIIVEHNDPFAETCTPIPTLRTLIRHTMDGGTALLTMQLCRHLESSSLGSTISTISTLWTPWSEINRPATTNLSLFQDLEVAHRYSAFPETCIPTCSE